MRHYRKGDKIAVAAYEVSSGNLLAPSKVISGLTPRIERLSGIQIFNLAIIEVPSDPYISFRAVDKTGESWLGFIMDIDDQAVKLKDVTVAMREEKYNIANAQIGLDFYFDLTEVMFDLHKTMKDNNRPHRAALAGDFYRKLRDNLDNTIV